MVKSPLAVLAAGLLWPACAFAADPMFQAPSQTPAQSPFLTPAQAQMAAQAQAPAAPPQAPANVSEGPIKIKPKKAAPAEAEALLAPDVSLIDTPTAAVIDYGSYSTTSRFFSGGGLLQHVSFGVFQGLNIGASIDIDAIIGSAKTVHVQDPDLQLKYRFYDGERWLPSLAAGYDGQGFEYNQPSKLYNNRHRGFFLVATEELGLPGLQIHPSFNVSDTNTRAFFGALPLAYNIRDKVLVMLEWDNINIASNSRFNAGLRAYVTPAFHFDLAVRAIGQNGYFSNGAPRGSERIVSLGYTGSF